MVFYAMRFIALSFAMFAFCTKDCSAGVNTFAFISNVFLATGFANI